jgi:hypothetical protein
VPHVVILTLSDTLGDLACCAAEPARVPVLACADALRDGGASVELLTAGDEAAIDAAIKPVEAGDAKLVVAAATDAELRAVVRRLVRRCAPPPSKRPAELPPNRTVFDLPPLGVLALLPAVPDLVRRLRLPRQPRDVAAATLAGSQRRLDLLRTDAGSVTLGGVLLGGIREDGRLASWRGRIEVDDAVLAEGTEPIVACSIRTVGASDVGGLPLVVDADPTDGWVQVAVAVPIMRRRLLREASVRFEVRRARGRVVSVTPQAACDVRYIDDGVSGVLSRKRAWWMEPAAWAVYVM